MDIESLSHENGGPFTRGWGWLKAMPEKLWAKAVDVAKKMKKLGEDDPRRIIHSLKVGLAINLVSLVIYIKPLSHDFRFENNAIWAVMTVTLVLEFSVGATLGKGLNRMLATLSGGALGVGVHCLATLLGTIGQPIVIGVFALMIAAAVTFVRFVPAMKARYDYGLLIFILTFCMISISSYGKQELHVMIKMAIQRLVTIILGSFVAIVICICICPVWIGENLHNLAATNMEKLGNFLEGFGGEYFNIPEEGLSNMDDKSFLQGYKSVLTSKDTEETMANLARWELWNSRFGFRHPWKQYLKIGALSRECAYKVDVLNSYLNSKIQTPSEFQSKIQEPCAKICSESGKALKEIAAELKKMTRTTSVNPHIVNSKMIVENLKSLLNTTWLWENANLQETVPTAAVVLIVMDIVPYIEKISEAIQELAFLARFKRVDARVYPI
ncbi:aluminum-activated malate transporter 2-like [Alnus glutinosa]|uniref:aluminum-activated malate transporter 2-like n=1 Tax=Alnus glutinosa TaxID=3517 RepID=UPI002D796D34|nr:aluminum-activated malate transporter 2-like [Alnus glutinosa]